jgi:hypothetical protein
MTSVAAKSPLAVFGASALGIAAAGLMSIRYVKVSRL